MFACQVLLPRQHGSLHTTDVLALGSGPLSVEVNVGTDHLPLVLGVAHLCLLFQLIFCVELIVLLHRLNLFLAVCLPLLKSSSASNSPLLFGFSLVLLGLVRSHHNLLFPLFCLLHKGKFCLIVVVVISTLGSELTKVRSRLSCERTEVLLRLLPCKRISLRLLASKRIRLRLLTGEIIRLGLGLNRFTEIRQIDTFALGWYLLGF